MTAATMSDAAGSGFGEDETLYFFRDELMVELQGSGPTQTVVVNDPVSGLGMSLGPAEFLVAKQFDGESTLEQIRERLESDRGVVIPIETLVAFRKNLHSLKIILAPGETVNRREAELQGAMRMKGLFARLLFIPVWGFDPDTFLTRLLHRTRFFFTPAFVGFSVVLMLLSIQIWLDQWHVIRAQSKSLNSAGSLVLLWFVIAISAALHEFAHGLTMKAFHGRVRGIGAAFYYLNLLWYTLIDEGSAYLRKGQLFMVFAAGAYTTFVLCFISTIGWRLTLPGTPSNHVFYLFMTFNAGAAAFTLTPLLKGDGYNMLRIVLELPGLRERAFEYASALLRRTFWDKHQKVPEVTDRERGIFLAYAAMAFIFAVIFLSIVAWSLLGWLFGKFEGWGLLPLGAVLLDRLRGGHEHESDSHGKSSREKMARGSVREWFADGWTSVRRFPAASFEWGREHKRRLLLLAAVVGILCIPYPVHVTGHFEVLAIDPPEVRAINDGIVEQMLVKSGDQVQKGQVLARLLDVEHKNDLARLQAEYARAGAQLALLKQGFRREEVEIARRKVEQADAEVALARSMHTRQDALFRDNVLSRDQFEQSRTRLVSKEKQLEQLRQDLKIKIQGARPEEIDEATAHVSALEHQVAMVKQRIAWSAVTAQVSGVVVTPDHELRAKLGRYVKRGEEIVKVLDRETLFARVEVPEREFGDVEIGQRVDLRTFQFPKETLQGTVERTELRVERAGEFLTAVSVLTRIDDPEERLRVGTTGIAKIDCGTRFVAYIIYRRLLRSVFVQLWSWW